MEEEIMGELRLPGEKREYPRMPLNVAVRYRVLENDEANAALGRNFDPDTILRQYSEGETIDVSKAGTLMFVNEEIPIKSVVAVNMYVSIPGIAANCKALAEVVRREKAPEGEKYEYKTGLKFLKIMHHNLKNYKFLNFNDLLDVKEQKY